VRSPLKLKKKMEYYQSTGTNLLVVTGLITSPLLPLILLSGALTSDLQRD